MAPFTEKYPRPTMAAIRMAVLSIGCALFFSTLQAEERIAARPAQAGLNPPHNSVVSAAVMAESERQQQSVRRARQVLPKASRMLDRGDYAGALRIIDEALAVYVEGHALSHGDLIAEVAQQMGSAHEDPSIDPHLVTLERIEIGGIASHGRTLMETGQLVYGAALGLIGHAVEQLSFIPQWRNW